MGTDTGGSIRGPVAANALVGIKPTQGLSSRAGIIPFSDSYDVSGPMARTVTDAAKVLNVISEVDAEDPSTYRGVGQREDDYTQFLDIERVEGVQLGIARDFFGGNAEVDDAIDLTIESLEGLEMDIIDPITLPEEAIDSINDIYYTVAETEFKHYLGEYLADLPESPADSLEEVVEISSEDKFLIDEDVLDRLISAANREPITGTDYTNTIKTGQQMIQDTLTITFEDHDIDALVAPGSACPPEPVPSAGDVEYECKSTPFRSALANISGYPEVSVPAGFTDAGLPISIDFLGLEFSEPTLLTIAYGYEREAEHRQPPEEYGSLSDS